MVSAGVVSVVSAPWFPVVPVPPAVVVASVVVVLTVISGFGVGFFLQAAAQATINVRTRNKAANYFIYLFILIKNIQL